MVVIIIWLGMQPVVVVRCSQWRDFVRAVLGKVARLFTVATLHIRAVATNMAYLSRDKHPSLLDIKLTVEDVRVAVVCYAALNFLTSLITSNKVWGSPL